ncbi:unnamed protein product, partial [Nesidiocoris tenuis]
MDSNLPILMDRVAQLPVSRRGPGELVKRRRRREAALSISRPPWKGKDGDTWPNCVRDGDRSYNRPSEREDSGQPLARARGINKRCLWRWAEDRASLASRWIWLQSQIADLDYKIRQANDLRKHIKNTKVPIRLEEPPTDCGDETCARVRPLKRVNFSKRRLVGLRSVLRLSKRAASRPATVRCSCRSRTVLPGGAGVSDHSCVLCSSRQGADPTGPRDPLEHLAPVHDRVSLLDPSYHPQSSFPSDVSQSLHYNAIMRTSEWQARAARVQQRNWTETAQDQTSRGRKPTSMGLAGGGSVALPPHQSSLPPAPSSSLLQDYHIDAERSRAAVVAVSSKMRRKSVPRGGRRGKRNHLGGANDRLTTKRSRKHQQHLGVDGRETSESADLVEEGSDSFQMPPSPAPSPASATSKDKEVISNKWRRVTFDPNAVNAAEHKNGVVRRPSHDVDGSSVDETTDEAFIARHERCEVEERKKFLSYMKKNAGAGSGAQAGAGGRGRGRARTDSRAESSGPNTPDPMSPDPAAAGDSLTSPPATPAPLDDPCAATASSLTSGARRRTVSSSKTPQATAEFPQSSYYVEYIPEGLHYEPRKFPLSDDEYSKMLADSSEGSSSYAFQNTFGKLHNPYELSWIHMCVFLWVLHPEIRLAARKSYLVKCARVKLVANQISLPREKRTCESSFSCCRYPCSSSRLSDSTKTGKIKNPRNTAASIVSYVLHGNLVYNVSVTKGINGAKHLRDTSRQWSKIRQEIVASDEPAGDKLDSDDQQRYELPSTYCVRYRYSKSMAEMESPRYVWRWEDSRKNRPQRGIRSLSTSFCTRPDVCDLFPERAMMGLPSECAPCAWNAFKKKIFTWLIETNGAKCRDMMCSDYV